MSEQYRQVGGRRHALIRGLMAALVLCCAQGLASADLTIDVFDLGSGQTRWVFGGSDTALIANSSVNSFWGQQWNGGAGDPVNNDGSVIYAFVSGGGSLTTTTLGTVAFTDVAVQDQGPGNQLISARVGTTATWNIGDTLSWTGDLVVNLPFADLNPGVYTTQSLLADAGGQVIAGNLILTIGGAAVPEPSSVSLLGLAALGLVIRRRRR